MSCQSDSLLLIGAGGHARSVLDIALENGQPVAGCLSPDYPTLRSVPGLEEIPIIGTDNDLERLFREGHRKIFVAIGNNRLRGRLYRQALEIGFEPVNLISRYARVSRYARLGRGICVMAGAVINIGCTVSDNVIVNTNSSLDHDCTVGPSCHIAPGTAVSGGVSIGEGVQLGTGCSVIDGVSIGAWSFLGAGSVVVSDIPDHLLAYGVPAKRIQALPR
ncbi:MAG: acetyltransferase [Provencibacterium sp.]|jgi:UDP-perosamine 4-acetyltransferase|nr:acetyltransferase [Provencibacterium sp.]